MFYHINKNETWIPGNEVLTIFLGSIIWSNSAPVSYLFWLWLTASFFSHKLTASFLPEALATIHIHYHRVDITLPNGSSLFCKQFRVNARNTGERTFWVMRQIPRIQTHNMTTSPARMGRRNQSHSLDQVHTPMCPSKTLGVSRNRMETWYLICSSPLWALCFFLSLALETYS